MSPIQPGTSSGIPSGRLPSSTTIRWEWHPTYWPKTAAWANISGEPSPQCFDEISPEILAKADYTVDYRRNDHRKAQASSVIKLTDDCRVTILRK